MYNLRGSLSRRAFKGVQVKLVIQQRRYVQPSLAVCQAAHLVYVGVYCIIHQHNNRANWAVLQTKGQDTGPPDVQCGIAHPVFNVKPVQHKPERTFCKYTDSSKTDTE